MHHLHLQITLKHPEVSKGATLFPSHVICVCPCVQQWHCITGPWTARWFTLAVCLDFHRLTNDEGQVSEQHTLTLALPELQVRQTGLLKIRIISTPRSVTSETAQNMVYAAYIIEPDCRGVHISLSCLHKSVHLNKIKWGQNRVALSLVLKCILGSRSSTFKKWF